MGKFELKAVSLIKGLPVKIGTLTLRNAQPDAITAITAFKGQKAAVKKALGGWVEAGETATTKLGRLVWSGMDQAFLFGHAGIEHAACVDISDGWTFMALVGNDADRVLERLVPIDFRSMKTGQVVRTQLGHLMAMIIVSDKGFDIGVMSSFAQSAKHEIESVMESLATDG